MPIVTLQRTKRKTSQFRENYKPKHESNCNRKGHRCKFKKKKDKITHFLKSIYTGKKQKVMTGIFPKTELKEKKEKIRDKYRERKKIKVRERQTGRKEVGVNFLSLTGVSTV